jgi:hypothetical protein
LVTLAIVLVSAQAAVPGALLKGVDVKLGISPGGGVAMRVTDASGAADFGALPNGADTLSVAPEPGISGLHLWVAGPAGGVVDRDIQADGADRTGPIRFSLDGTTPLKVQVASDADGGSGLAPPFGIQLMRAPHRRA